MGYRQAVSHAGGIDDLECSNSLWPFVEMERLRAMNPVLEILQHDLEKVFSCHK